jgi:predicted CXXCH cytochrome family protein
MNFATDNRMKTISFFHRLLPRSRRLRGVVSLAAVSLLLFVAISCSTTRQAVVLPDVPGAKYVGSADCEQCHDEICRSFKTADHARLVAQGKNGLGAGCESCHGPCSLHEDSGGDVKPPFIFAAGRLQPEALSGRFPLDPARSVENTCYQCHMDVRGQFNLPNHHPVPEGRMSCIECHPPHGGTAMAGGGTQLLSLNDNCVRCHPAQQGPFVFEHEALREGCVSCHSPHGSVNDKLLTERNANLCLKCHFQQVQNGAILIGGVDHTSRLSQGACWSAGCHEAVHGSRVSPSLRF